MKKYIINIIIVFGWSSLALAQEEDLQKIDTSYQISSNEITEINQMQQKKLSVDIYFLDMIKKKFHSQLNGLNRFDSKTNIFKVWNFSQKEEVELLIKSIDYHIILLDKSIASMEDSKFIFGNEEYARELGDIIRHMSGFGVYYPHRTEFTEVTYQGFKDQDAVDAHMLEVRERDTLIYQMNLCDFTYQKYRLEYKELKEEIRITYSDVESFNQNSREEFRKKNNKILSEEQELIYIVRSLGMYCSNVFENSILSEELRGM